MASFLALEFERWGIGKRLRSALEVHAVSPRRPDCCHLPAAATCPPPAATACVCELWETLWTGQPPRPIQQPQVGGWGAGTQASRGAQPLGGAQR